MSPLALVELAAEGKEQADRRAEKVVIVQEPLQARGLVLSRNAEQGVHRLTHLEAARAPRLGELGRVDRDLRLVAERVLGDGFPDRFDQPVAARAGHHMDPPWLEIAAGGRPAGDVEDLADIDLADRRVEKGAGGNAGFDGFCDGHDCLYKVRAVRA